MSEHSHSISYARDSAAGVDAEHPMRVALFRGRGMVSALIRWQTRSPVSHAALVYPDARTIIESWQGAGVRRKRLGSLEGIRLFEVVGMTVEEQRNALEWAERQLGCKYDWLGVLRFVSRRRMGRNRRWFCSELVDQACMLQGCPLVARVDAAQVSPGMLYWSPRLREVQWPSYEGGRT